MSALTGKVVIVTGGGSGIGRGIALAAASAGAKVVVADIGVTLHGDAQDTPVADQVVAEISAQGGQAIAATDSVATTQGARNNVGAALTAFGQVDGVVCCAGILRHRPFLELTEADFDAVVATHLKGHFLMFQATLAAMVDKGNGGSMIGISSGYLSGDPARAAYRSAKAGVVALTKSAALAGQEHGVRANVISPVANTRMTKASNLKFDSDPADIAPMAVYLLSDRATGINGEVFGVFGNSIALWEDAFEGKKAQHHSRWKQADIDAIMPWLISGTGATMAAPPPLPDTAKPK